jgi:single-strand DNA-binding protein
MNVCAFSGRLSKRPEVRMTENGKSVTSGSIAVKGYGDKTTWLNYVVWGSSAEFLAKYADKGDMIGINGRLEQRKYTNKDGIEMNIYEVVCNNVEILNQKNREGNKDQDTSQSSYATGDFKEVPKDDDLPF